MMDEIVREPDAARTHELGVRLIKGAFTAARASGREDWQRMTVAVLKNRLLDLTERGFHESQWGARSFRDFVEQFPEVVAVEYTTHPPIATLVPGAELGPTPAASPQSEGAPASDASIVERPDRRVREDLWRAVLDYRSSLVYVWVAGEARPLERDQEPAGRPVLPTLTADEAAEWRAVFVADHIRQGTETSATMHALLAWQTQGLSTAVLPHRLRGLWNGTLKRNVFERLEAWFVEHDIASPPDLVQGRAPRPAAVDATDELRRLVLRCVQMMTHEELEALQLPALSVVRASR